MLTGLRYTTVPQVAAEVPVGLDWLRRLIRQRDDLRAMLRTVGPTRVVAADRVDEFIAAVRAARG